MSRLSNIFRHLFLPGYSNNQKAKLLHTESIVIIALLLISGQFIFTRIPRSVFNILGFASQIPVDEVIRLTNEKRAQYGVSSLTKNSQLSEAARRKGEDMLSKDYWAHVSPDGTQPWRFFTDVGYKYKYAGENLAKDFSNPQSAVDAWMASPSHKENLLSTKYDEIGIAVVEGDLNGVDTTIVIQLFGRRYDTSIASVTTTGTNTGKIAEGGEEIKPTAVPKITDTPTPQPTPSPTPVVVANVNPSTPTPFQVLISPFSTKKGFSALSTISLLVIFIVDGLYLYRKKIVRIGGTTFTHILFLTMILAVIVILQSGDVLPPAADIIK